MLSSFLGPERGQWLAPRKPTSAVGRLSPEGKTHEMIVLPRSRWNVLPAFKFSTRIQNQAMVRIELGCSCMLKVVALQPCKSVTKVQLDTMAGLACSSGCAVRVHNHHVPRHLASLDPSERGFSSFTHPLPVG